MNLSELKYKSNYYALILLVFVIPLERKLIAPFTILFFVTSILNGSVNNLKINFKTLLFGLIYLGYCIGTLYSQNINIATKDLMTKLPLLIIPIGFVISKVNWRDKINSIFKSFIDGCFASALIAMIYSLVQFYFNDKSSSFFYGNISLFAHPSYLAAILNLAIIYVYYTLINSSKVNLKKILLITFFSIYILLLASKTGLITMILTHLIFITIYSIKKKKFISSSIIMLIMTGTVFFAYYSSLTFKTRINDLFTTSSTEINYESSTAARSVIWKICLEKIAEQPILGYGTGDVKSILISEYENQDLTYFIEKKLNAHNQFLQTSLAIGLIGGLVLLLMLVLPLFYSIKNKQVLYISFLLLVCINFFTEAMLERQVGVIFYAVFNSLFLLSCSSHPNTTKK